MTRITPASAVLIVAAGALAGHAHGQTQLWIHQFGTSAGDWGVGLAPDDAGGVFVAGRTEGSLAGPNAGSMDAWLARYDGGGARLWIQQFGTSGEDRTAGVSADGSGGAFIAGSTTASLGGPAAGGYDAWLARYDAAGSRAWVIQFGTGLAEQPTGLASEGSGGVFITWGVGWSGPTAGAWLARYDGTGNQLWDDHIGPAVSSWAVASDGAGGCFVAGTGAGGAFLARYDGAGAQLWVRQFGSGTEDVATGLAPAGAGGVFIAGFTQGNLGGPSAGGRDAWVASYDAPGTQIWIRQLGTSGYEWTSGLSPDGAGGSLVYGSTPGSLGGPSAGGEDAWIARHDAGGNQAWIIQLGTSVGDGAGGATPDGGGGFFVTGSTSGSLGGPSAGSSDIWIARYGDTCYADCNADGSLTVADFGCFQTKFVSGDPYADCNADGQHTVADFGCFQTAFVAGCP